MAVEEILYTDNLRSGTDKINKAIDQANKSESDSSSAVITSTAAKVIAESAENKSDSTQLQLDNIVISSGTSDAETIQARGTETLLYKRLDKTDQQLQDKAQQSDMLAVESLRLKLKYKAILDGTYHPLSERYTTLVSAQALYPKATALTDSIDWCAIQTSLDVEQTTIVGGHAVINKSLEIKKGINHNLFTHGVILRGTSLEAFIEQTTDNIPIVIAIGHSNDVTNVRLKFTNVQPKTNTNAICLLLIQTAWSNFKNIQTLNGAYGILSKNQTYTYLETNVNWVFSTTFKNIKLADFTYAGMYLDTFNSGTTGNSFDAIYIKSRENPTYGLFINQMYDFVFNQLNTEALFAEYPIYLQNSTGIINGINMEENTLTKDMSAMITVKSLSNIIVNSMWVFDSIIKLANVPTYASIVQVEDNSHLMLNGCRVDNTREMTAPNYYVVSGKNLTQYASIIINNFIENGVNGTTKITGVHFNCVFYPIPALKKYNDEIFYQKENGLDVIFAPSLPTAKATYTKPFKLYNTAVSTSNPILGWVGSVGTTGVMNGNPVVIGSSAGNVFISQATTNVVIGDYFEAPTATPAVPKTKITDITFPNGTDMKIWYAGTFSIANGVTLKFANPTVVAL